MLYVEITFIGSCNECHRFLQVKLTGINGEMELPLVNSVTRMLVANDHCSFVNLKLL